MTHALTDIDLLARGVAAGAAGVFGLAVFRSGVGRSPQIAAGLVAISVISWLFAESRTLIVDIGGCPFFLYLSFPVGGLFWLFVVTVFEDRPLSPAMFAPAAVLMLTGLIMQLAPAEVSNAVWYVHNGFSGLLAIHAGLVIARGWNGDLLEVRRRLRAVVLGFAAAFSLMSVVLGYAARLDPQGPWIKFTVGRLYGGLVFSLLMLAAASVFLQARSAVFGASRRPNNMADARAEAAERQMLAKLNQLMAGGGWRREGLTIGGLAAQLEEPEHRLRRLINQRLGHRNFAEYVNSFRIAAAKARLSDPAEARTTVAAIAFDLGYGSLGPFNRAFRAATGVTPTEWRRDALATSPELQDAV